jgi:hypothetical protein
MDEVRYWISVAHCTLCIGTVVLIDSINVITKMEKRKILLKIGLYQEVVD